MTFFSNLNITGTRLLILATFLMFSCQSAAAQSDDRDQSATVLAVLNPESIVSLPPVSTASNPGTKAATKPSQRSGSASLSGVDDSQFADLPLVANTAIPAAASHPQQRPESALIQEAERDEVPIHPSRFTDLPKIPITARSTAASQPPQPRLESALTERAGSSTPPSQFTDLPKVPIEAQPTATSQPQFRPETARVDAAERARSSSPPSQFTDLPQAPIKAQPTATTLPPRRPESVPMERAESSSQNASVAAPIVEVNQPDLAFTGLPKTDPPQPSPNSSPLEFVPPAVEPKSVPSPLLETHELQPDNATWWKPLVTQPFGESNQEQPVDTHSLVFETVQNSPRIRAVSQNPLIRDLQIVEADAEFDPISFIRSQFEDRYDPVGDALAGVPDGVLKDNIWTADFGLRRKLRTGATYELGQRLGFKNSNSSFFTPNDQGTATLALNVSQPLLRGRGRYYNQSQILIAQSASGAAWDTFSAELQDEIEEIVSAYWRLYYDRSSYLQKQRNVERGINVLNILEGRRDLDSLPSQITRARSAVKSRKTDLANALRDIRDAETEIRRLTANRNWRSNQDIELIPVETPLTEGINVELEQVVLTAIEHRPEIKETMERAKIAGIQRDISENELLPELSLLLGTYVSGLEGDSQLGRAIRNQWADTTPGYSVGFEFELPIRNRAASSRYSQRKLQLEKISAEVDETMLNVVAESQIAWRQVTSAKETLDAAFQAILAARADLEQNHRRWELFALIEGDLADGQTPTTMLDQLLDSQERLTAAELVYTQSELDLKTSEVALQRSMGTLLIHQNVTYGKTECADPPEMLIDQNQMSHPQSMTPTAASQSPMETQVPGISNSASSNRNRFSNLRVFRGK